MLRQESRRRAVVRIATMLSALTVATLSAVAPAGAANRGSDDTRKVRAISSPATLPAWLHKLPPRQYTTFDGAHTFSLTPWQGRHVAVMVPDTRSTPVMIKIVQALDSAWSYYRSRIEQAGRRRPTGRSMAASPSRSSRTVKPAALDAAGWGRLAPKSRGHISTSCTTRSASTASTIRCCSTKWGATFGSTATTHRQ